MGDGSIQPSGEEEKKIDETNKMGGMLHVTTVELITKKLSAVNPYETDPGCLANGSGGLHSISYEEEIPVVIQALQSAFNTSAGRNGDEKRKKFDKTWMYVNDSCDLHVHVGNQRRGFRLPILKNVFHLAAAYERTIESMTASNRIGCTWLGQIYSDLETAKFVSEGRPTDERTGQNVYNNAPSTYFVVSAYRTSARSSHFNKFVPDRTRFPESELSAVQLDKIGSSYEPADFLGLTDMSPSISALQTMIAPDPHHATLNSENLGEYDNPRIENISVTFEFRQQKGLITVEEFLPWVDFVLSWVKHAAHYQGTAIYQQSLTECSNPHPNLDDFLTSLSVSPATKTLYLQRTDQHTDAMDAVARADAFGPGHPITDIAKFVTKARCDTHRAANIQQTIRKKFCPGRYGRCPREYLDALPFSPSTNAENVGETKETLVPGYEVQDALLQS